MKKGEVFRIKTNLGYGFMQFIEIDDLGIEFVRILEPLNQTGELTQNEVDQIERWNIGFPLKAAMRRKLVERVGNFKIPSNYIIPKFAREKHNVRGEFLGWHIVNRTSLTRELKRSLNSKDLKLSPNGIMNDTHIIERLEQGWKLEEWN